MSTHNIRFLWRTVENYPIIITEYSSLTIPLLRAPMNPFMPGTHEAINAEWILLHVLNSLDMSISYIKNVWLVFILIIFNNNF